MSAALLRLLRGSLNHRAKPDPAPHYIAMLGMPKMGILLHLFFLIYFWCNAQPTLVWINLACACSFAVCEALVRRRRMLAAAVLMTVDGCVYSLLNVWLLGWSSGAQWLSLIVLLPHYLFLDIPARYRIYFTTFVCAMLNLGILIGFASPPRLSMGAFPWLRVLYINIVLLYIILELIAGQRQRVAALSTSQERIVKMEEETLLDPLTGLYNRRYLDNHFHSWLAQSETGVAALVMMDLDDFKSINDTYLHVVGDKALIAFAAGLKTLFRRSDLWVRWGGDEFLLALLDVNEEGATHLLEKLTDYLAHTPYASAPDGTPLRLSYSAGVCAYDPALGLEEAIARCDEKMYIHKQRYRCASIPKPGPGSEAAKPVKTQEHDHEPNA